SRAVTGSRSIGNGSGPGAAVVAAPVDRIALSAHRVAVRFAVEPCLPTLTKTVARNPPGSAITFGTRILSKQPGAAQHRPIRTVSDGKRTDRRGKVDDLSGNGRAQRFAGHFDILGRYRTDSAADDNNGTGQRL